MEPRELSDKQRKWLEAELADWNRQELISADQASKILGLYESAEAVGVRKQSKFTFAIMSLAATLVGFAVLLLVGYNWDALPRAAKLFAIFGTILGTHAGALYLRFVRGAPRAGEIVAFLACLFYGAGIWLVAQVFHVDSHYPDGMWWWAIGVLPFALCLDTVLLHCLVVALLGTWAGMEIIGFSNLAVRLFWGWWNFPNGAYTLPLMALPGLIWAYRKNSPFTAWLYVPLLGWWIVLQAFAWDMEWQMVYIVGMVGALFLVIAEVHRVGSPFAVAYRFWGTALVAGTLIPLTYTDFHRELYRWYGPSIDSAVFGDLAQLAAIVILAAAVLAACAYLRSSGAVSSIPARLVELARRQWVPVSLAIGMAAMLLGSIITRSLDSDGGAVWLVILANGGMVGLALWLMRVGLADDRGRPFIFGVLYFLLWAILRYIDLFAGMGGMLGAALMFFLVGAALFGVGMFWRKRKAVRHV